MSSVEIYTKPNCPHCVRAKQILSQHSIPYTEYVIGSGHSKEDIQKKINGMGLSAVVLTVPQIFYKNKSGKVTYIGGCSDLQANLAILGT